MERLILARDVSAPVSFFERCTICDCAGLVKKGHEECGDSLFFHCNENFVIAGVFDGVSGGPGAPDASSIAAKTILSSLATSLPQGKITQKNIELAFNAAHKSITSGMTTATVCVLSSDGTYLIASVGDSTIYYLDKSGKVVLINSLDRVVENKNSIFRFFYYRTFISAALGESNKSLIVHFKSGRIKSGETLLLASDCLIDNLYHTISDGYVTDCSGREDLENLLKKKMLPPLFPEMIIKLLSNEIDSRVRSGRLEKPGLLLVPKQDDLSLIALCFK